MYLRTVLNSNVCEFHAFTDKNDDTNVQERFVVLSGRKKKNKNSFNTIFLFKRIQKLSSLFRLFISLFLYSVSFSPTG